MVLAVTIGMHHQQVRTIVLPAVCPKTYMMQIPTGVFCDWLLAEGTKPFLPIPDTNSFLAMFDLIE